MPPVAFNFWTARDQPGGRVATREILSSARRSPRWTAPIDLLKPCWNQEKPTPGEAQDMCLRVSITPLEDKLNAVAEVLEDLRRSHSHGGTLFATFSAGHSDVFDWFASRNRLAEFSILPVLLRRTALRFRPLARLLAPDHSRLSSNVTHG